MKKALSISVAVLMLVLSSCGPAEVEEVAVESTVPVTVPVTVPITVEVPVTVVVTATPLPEPTQTPTQEVGDVKDGIAANYIDSQTRGDVTIELVRVLCESAEVLKSSQGLSDQEFLDSFPSDPQTMCMFILSVTNDREEMISVYPDQGTVILGSEQIDLSPFDVARIGTMDDISGDLYSGIQRLGGFWFGVQRVAWDEVESITYIVRSPVNENLDRLGEEYRFEIDTSGWGFEPIPEELE